MAMPSQLVRPLPFSSSKKTSNKVHRVLVEAVITALGQTFFENQYADKVLEKIFKDHREWGARDRRFIAETFYECVRWWRKYWFLLNEEVSSDKLSLLRLWAIHWLLTDQNIPDWPELKEIKEIDVRQRLRETKTHDAIVQSIPDWLHEMGIQELGERWNPILKALNQTASVDLRCNTLKINRDDLRAQLLKESVDTDLIQSVPNALTLKERRNVFTLSAFKEGFFEVQDRSSQCVAPFLEVVPGQRIIDACAGGGGKSLHLGALLKNKGKLIAMDIYDWKLKELRNRAIRNGIDIIETRHIDSSKVVKRLNASADRVLLDVPCSGVGVLRRNPDAKWKLTKQKIENLQQTQKEILDTYSDMTKVGGKLVYATCSVFPSENERQIEWFLAKNPSWILEEQLRLDPDQKQGDGFFAARLLRRASKV